LFYNKFGVYAERIFFDRFRRIEMAKMRKDLNMQHRESPPKRELETETQFTAQSVDETTTYYVHGPHGIHAQQRDGDWQWMVQDGLNSVRSVVDNELAVLESVVNDPFGNPTAIVGMPQTAYGYTGEPTDPNGLVYLRERYYNPSMGAFISQDPYAGSMNDPMTLNGYAYVQNNPVNRIDPSGMFSVPTMNGLMSSNPTAFANAMNTGMCMSMLQQSCEPFCTNTFSPTPSYTSTPSATQTPMILSNVFGSTNAVPLPGATTQLFGPGHYAVDLVPFGSANAAGVPVYAVCDGYADHKGNQADNPYFDTVLQQTCGNDPDRNLLIYSHVCPADNLPNFIPAGTQIGTIAEIGGNYGRCNGVDSRSGFEYFGSAHLHFEVQRVSAPSTATPVPGATVDPSQQYIAPSLYLAECQGANPPSWCADASNSGYNFTPTPTNSPTVTP
jgi:RHS repeat-associated protein